MAVAGENGGKCETEAFRNGHFNTGGANGYSGEMRKVPAMENPLPVSLEDLYKGVVKKMRITRNVYDASGYVPLLYLPLYISESRTRRIFPLGVFG